MKTTFFRCLGPLLAAFPLVTAGEPSAAAPAITAYVPPPYAVAQEHFRAGELDELEELVQSLVKSEKRNADGEFELATLTRMMTAAVVLDDSQLEAKAVERIHDWMKNSPNAAFPPILEASRLRETAWRARGNGYASEVSDEGWEIFRERNRAAWELLMANKSRSSVIPEWYVLAMGAGQDLNLPEERIRAIFDEGKKRFPVYHEIYFQYLRDFAPRWGGSYEQAGAFIREQADDAHNREGDMLFARLYWALDSYSGRPRGFFEEARPDWPRMRQGFDLLMQAYPKSEKNLAVFGAFACRASDAETYARLRPQLKPSAFSEFVSRSYALEICDRRFAPRTSVIEQ